jgi:hypothetical protein
MERAEPDVGDGGSPSEVIEDAVPIPDAKSGRFEVMQPTTCEFSDSLVAMHSRGASDRRDRVVDLGVGADEAQLG